MSLQELSERALELTVWDHDRIASNEFLGGMRFSLGTGRLTFLPCYFLICSVNPITFLKNTFGLPITVCLPMLLTQIFNFLAGKHYAKPVDWMDSTGKEVTLWQQMLERPNLWVESSITLRSSLERSAILNNSMT